MPPSMQLRHKKYLNNNEEKDHSFIKKRVRSLSGFKSFRTVTYILSVIEVMYMIKKKQVQQGGKSAQNKVEFIYRLFRITFKGLSESGTTTFFYLPWYLHQNLTI